MLEGRPEDGEAPRVLVERGWASFLASLDDAQLAAVEISGHDAVWPEGTPPSLLALAARARAVCAVPSLAPPDAPEVAGVDPRRARRRERPRKRAQVDAFARVILPLAARAARVVDVGSGHGHLTREIAERIAVPVVGLERDGDLAGRARTLSASASPSFAIMDVLGEGLPVEPGDCVIGLHACGDLGDAMVESVARARASLALVGCCLQKRSAPSRRALCGDAGEALDLPRPLLGLSNLTARDEGVEATRTENLAGRERRLALHRLLTGVEGAGGAGGALRLGAEIEGLNRRVAQRDLPSLVARAFELRGRPSPSATAIEEAAAWAHVRHARTRRFSLPRMLLARALEVFVVLDRALYLEARGYEVATGILFPLAVSARNLVLLARPRAGL